MMSFNYINKKKNLGNGDIIQKALFELTTQSTVPNIFINRNHIGGK